MLARPVRSTLCAIYKAPIMYRCVASMHHPTTCSPGEPGVGGNSACLNLRSQARENNRANCHTSYRRQVLRSDCCIHVALVRQLHVFAMLEQTSESWELMTTDTVLHPQRETADSDLYRHCRCFVDRTEGAPHRTGKHVLACM